MRAVWTKPYHGVQHTENWANGMIATVDNRGRFTEAFYYKRGMPIAQKAVFFAGDGQDRLVGDEAFVYVGDADHLAKAMQWAERRIGLYPKMR